MKAFAVLSLTLVIFAALESSASARGPRWHELEGYSFERYVQDFQRTYANDEEHQARKSLFEARLAEVASHNANPGFTWKKGVNQFTDRTESEIRAMLGYQKHSYVSPNSKTLKTRVSPDSFPGFMDWRKMGVVSEVKDQGQCGSCWSFAAAETVESHFALANNLELPILSEQQILDCTANPNECGGTGGCGGGTAELAFDMMVQYGGLAQEWTYPYISYFGQNQTCQITNGSQIVPFANISGHVKLDTNSYESLMQAISSVGPVAVSVEAYTWASYESGVFDGCNKTNPDLDHAVQLVGYGTDPELGDYWLIRNSWSPAWGENGYIRIKKQGANASCGMDLNPQDGSACKNETSPIKVCGTCGILYDNSYPLL